MKTKFKNYSFLVLIVFLIYLSSCGQNSNREQDQISTPKNDTTAEHLIYKGELVELYVEKTIYHSTTTNNFILKLLL